MKKLSIDYKLPINQCGKLIIASNKKQLKDLEKIYKNSISCNRGVSLIDYSEAKKIQPNVKKAEAYLWSPKTSIFSQKMYWIFYNKLLEEGVGFIKDKVDDIDISKKVLTLANNKNITFNYLFNCAGSGALNIFKKLFPLNPL